MSVLDSDMYFNAISAEINKLYCSQNTNQEYLYHCLLCRTMSCQLQLVYQDQQDQLLYTEHKV